MKKILKNLTSVLLLFICIFSQSNLAVASTVENVLLFKDGNYEGNRLSLPVGTYNLKDYPEIGDKQLSSLKIPEGYIVTLYHYDGDSENYLFPGSYSTIPGTHKFLKDWNDATSRIKIEYFAPAEFEINKKRYEANSSKVNEVANLVKNPSKIIGIQDTIKSNFNIENTKVENINSSQKLENRNLYYGETTLTNNLDTEQTLNSSAFDFTENNTVKTTTTNVVGTTFSVSSSFELPLIGNLNSSISAKYDFSKANSNSQSTTVTYKVPQQSIKLKPHQTVIVRAKLIKTKTSGNVKMTGNVIGSENGEILVAVIGPQQDWFRKPYSFNLNTPVTGYGTYEADYGSSLFVEVIDKDSNKVVKTLMKPIDSLSLKNNNEIENSKETINFSEQEVIDMTK
ncbi:ETX/MTX2 family pore-forming toxin [Clostridium perfringens]|nr:ETX/MTX2 family pore-forming toxin [Clostridium perfringens]